MEEKSQIFSLKSSAVEVEFHKDNSPVEYGPQICTQINALRYFTQLKKSCIAFPLMVAKSNSMFDLNV